MNPFGPGILTDSKLLTPGAHTFVNDILALAATKKKWTLLLIRYQNYVYY